MTRLLATRHRRQELPHHPLQGDEVVLSHGEDLEVGVAAIQEGVALCHLAERRHLRLGGRHRARFLHNMSTCQVKDLTPGQGRHGLTVARDGKLVAEFVVEAEDESLRLEASGPGCEAIEAHLRAHIIADDVQIESIEGLDVLALVGPRVEVTLETLGFEPSTVQDDYAWQDVVLAGVPTRLRRNPGRLGVPGWDLTVAWSDAESLWDALCGAGAQAVGMRSWDAVRIAAGIPRVPEDMGPDNIPLESPSLTSSIDWDKGCYIGQEVIAMMHYRGRPNRHLVVLRGADGSPPEPATPLVADNGKTIGVIGTSTPHATDGEAWLSLGVVKRDAAIIQNTMQTATGHQLVVISSPLENT